MGDVARGVHASGWDVRFAPGGGAVRPLPRETRSRRRPPPHSARARAVQRQWDSRVFPVSHLSVCVNVKQWEGPPPPFKATHDAGSGGSVSPASRTGAALSHGDSPEPSPRRPRVRLRLRPAASRAVCPAGPGCCQAVGLCWGQGRGTPALQGLAGRPGRRGRGSRHAARRCSLPRGPASVLGLWC